MPKSSAFTLIELLVAISILAIISTIGFVSYSSAQMLARDSKRQQDLRSIATALELYYRTNKQYPGNTDDIGSCQSGWCNSNRSPQLQWLPQLDSNYINKLPIDPNNSGTCTSPIGASTCLLYLYWSGNITSYTGCPPTGQFFALVAQMENTNDPNTIGKPNKDVKWCDGRSTKDFYNFNPNNFVITSQ